MCWSRFQSPWTLWSWYLLGCPALHFMEPSFCVLCGHQAGQAVCCSHSPEDLKWPDYQAVCHKHSDCMEIVLGSTWWYEKKGYKRWADICMHMYVCTYIYINFISNTHRGKSGKLHNSDVINSSFWIAGFRLVFHMFIACTILREPTLGLSSASTHNNSWWFGILLNFSKSQLFSLYKWK